PTRRSSDLWHATFVCSASNHKATDHQSGKQCQHDQCANEPELFRNDCEDKIGVSFRQEEQLLYRVTQANPRPFAASKGNQRLSQLVAAIELIFRWVQIAHEDRKS